LQKKSSKAKEQYQDKREITWGFNVLRSNPTYIHRERIEKVLLINLVQEI